MQKRPGEILGIHVRSVIRALPAERVELREYQSIAESIDPTGWYDWSSYLEMIHGISARVPSEVLVQAGKTIVHRAKQHFADQGYDSLEKLYRDAELIYNANSRNMLAEDIIRAIEFEPGRVLVEASETHVPELMEGYMRGAAEAYDAKVTSFNAFLVQDIPPRYRYELRYETQ